MITLLPIALIGGFAAYIAWAWQAVAQGVSPWLYIVGAPLVYLAIPAITTTFWFALAWKWRTPRPPDARLGLAGSLRLWLGEVRAIALSIPLLAFHRSFVRDPAPASSSSSASSAVTTPIILVHGLVCNEGVWF